MNRCEIKVLSAIFVLLFILSLGFTHEFKITKNTSDQWGPAIYGDMVVWTDERNSNKDVYGFNLQTKKEFQITTDPYDQCCPEIYKDIVIWVDERNGNRDIYGFNLQTKKEFQITTDPYEQWYPAIYKDIIVFVDYRDNIYRIYKYNLSTSEEFPIITYKAPYWSSMWRPYIYGDILIWMDEVTTPDISFPNIHGYNLVTSEEFHIPADEPFPRFSPAIYGNNILWTERRYGNFDIFGYNLQKHEEFQITKDQNDQGGPAIYGDMAMWFGDSNDSNTLYGYNTSTQEPFQIATTPGIKGTLALYGDIIVWSNKRTNHEGLQDYDIYGYNLSKTYIGFHFTWIDALIFFIVITGITLFLRRTQIKESLNRKTMTRLLVSMGVSLILVVIGYLGLKQGSSLFGLAQIINFFMIMFYKVFFQNPLYEKIGYFVTFLFWTGVSYVIIKLWRD